MVRENRTGHRDATQARVLKDSDHDLAEDLASTADMLAARPDLWRSDPLPRAEPLLSDPTTVPRKGLSRLGRSEAAARPRRTAAQAPDAPRQRRSQVAGAMHPLCMRVASRPARGLWWRRQARVGGTLARKSNANETFPYTQALPKHPAQTSVLKTPVRSLGNVSES